MEIPSDLSAPTTPVDLWYGTAGPKDAKIVFVCEAWGAEEANAKQPLVGNSGYEFTKILAEAGLKRDQVLLTNTVSARPYGNDFWRMLDPIEKREKGDKGLRGIHASPFVLSEIARMRRQIDAFPRALVVACGRYPLWALTPFNSANRYAADQQGRPIPPVYVPGGIETHRGSMTYMLENSLDGSEKLSTTRLLPIIHPAAILRQWSLRATTVHDLRARVPMALSGDWRRNPAPVFWAPPTYSQAESRLRNWLAQADNRAVLRLSADIETRKGLITCIGFADSVNFAMSIPFVRKAASGGFDTYWKPEQEAVLHHLMARVLSHPNILIEGQNFLYDIQYIQHWMMTKPNLDWDTNVAQNTLFPGTPKDLAMLASLYCRYYWYWKEDAKEWDEKGTLEQHLIYNCQDNVNTFEVATTQRQMMKHYGLQEQWELKKWISGFCLDMMNNGVPIHKQRRVELVGEIATTLNKLHSEIEYIVPQSMVPAGTLKNEKNKTPWYRSATQTKAILHIVLGMPRVKKRGTDKDTSGKEARNDLLKKAPEWAGLLERLGMAATLRNTSGVLQAPLEPDGRMRCFFNPGGPETHRLSSSKNVFGRGTNLQNLTKGNEDD